MKKIYQSPELLAPAGSLEMMRSAFSFGADAVYAGQPRYSLRVRNNNFDKLETLSLGINEAHHKNKLFFLVCNIVAHNSKVKTFANDIKPLIELNPDALIMSDPGLIMMVREKFPDIAIHLSVQANTTNYAAVNFWKDIGVERIILSRELSLKEIHEIRQECPDIELEVFIHGALCIAYSGRCLLSGYFNHRDPNQGACTNACRWEYKIEENIEINKKNSMEKYISKEWFIEEKQRPGELMPIEEDEHGTYILNSKDLRAIEHVEQLCRIGVNSLKIEGRTKSPYYVARTCHTYREAINDACAGRKFNPDLLGKLQALANRGYTDGFYQRHHTPSYQNYMAGQSERGTSLLVGEVIGFDPFRKLAKIAVKNQFSLGDILEFLIPGQIINTPVTYIENKHNEACEHIPGGGNVHAWLPLPDQISPSEPCFISKLL